MSKQPLSDWPQCTLFMANIPVERWWQHFYTKQLSGHLFKGRFGSLSLWNGMPKAYVLTDLHKQAMIHYRKSHINKVTRYKSASIILSSIILSSPLKLSQHGWTVNSGVRKWSTFNRGLAGQQTAGCVNMPTSHTYSQYAYKPHKQSQAGSCILVTGI